MFLKKIYRTFYRDIICARKPAKYAEKIGVNFPRGGGTYLWQSRMVNRTVVDYFGP